VAGIIAITVADAGRLRQGGLSQSIAGIAGQITQLIAQRLELVAVTYFFSFLIRTAKNITIDKKY
jgi:electron transfer flavoprotein alpha/beta subunit